MTGANKILTVSYGTFSCTLEGFDEPFDTMKAIAEYFRDLAADDRFFGAEPPVPDADMLARIAEEKSAQRVEARVRDGGVDLRIGGPEAPGRQAASRPEPQPEPRPAPRAQPQPQTRAMPYASAEDEPLSAEVVESVAAKLQRIRAAVAGGRAGAAPAAAAVTFAEDEEEAEPAPQPTATAPVEETAEAQPSPREDEQAAEIVAEAVAAAAEESAPDAGEDQPAEQNAAEAAAQDDAEIAADSIDGVEAADDGAAETADAGAADDHAETQTAAIEVADDSADTMEPAESAVEMTETAGDGIEAEAAETPDVEAAGDIGEAAETAEAEAADTIAMADAVEGGTEPATEADGIDMVAGPEPQDETTLPETTEQADAPIEDEIADIATAAAPDDDASEDDASDAVATDEATLVSLAGSDAPAEDTDLSDTAERADAVAWQEQAEAATDEPAGGMVSFEPAAEEPAEAGMDDQAEQILARIAALKADVLAAMPEQAAATDETPDTEATPEPETGTEGEAWQAALDDGWAAAPTDMAEEAEEAEAAQAFDAKGWKDEPATETAAAEDDTAHAARDDGMPDASWQSAWDEAAATARESEDTDAEAADTFEAADAADMAAQDVAGDDDRPAEQAEAAEDGDHADEAVAADAEMPDLAATAEADEQAREPEHEAEHKLPEPVLFDATPVRPMTLLQRARARFFGFGRGRNAVTPKADRAAVPEPADLSEADATETPRDDEMPLLVLGPEQAADATEPADLDAAPAETGASPDAQAADAGAEALRIAAEIDRATAAADERAADATEQPRTIAEDLAEEEAAAATETAGDDAEPLGPHIPFGHRADDAMVARIADKTDSEMAGPETRRRQSAISHLKAAVAATQAERESGTAEEELPRLADAPFREDLSQAIRPRRPVITGEAGHSRPDNAEPRPDPLVLGASQRIDRTRPEKAVQPRRISTRNLMRDDFDPEEEEFDDTTPTTAEAMESSRNFADFAERMGANNLPELLEAAAAYTSAVEGHAFFSRPQILQKVARIADDADFSREESLRSFGMLLRQGKIQKIRRGQFVIASTSKFMAEARRAQM